MVKFNIPEDEENPNTATLDLTDCSDAFKAQANKQKSTMTILTMDKSKSFYKKEYKKKHIGESRMVSYFSAFRCVPSKI